MSDWMGAGPGTTPPNGSGGPPQGALPAYLPRPVAEPDWSTLAERHAADGRRRRFLLVGGSVLGVGAIAGIVSGALALQGSQADEPKPEAGRGTAAPTTAVATSPAAPVSGTPFPTPAPAPTALVDSAGGVTAKPASNAQLVGQGGRNGRTPALALDGSLNSYAQTSGPVVDSSRSFTVSAWVRNDAPTGTRAAVSQGGDDYYSLYLGREYYNGQNRWVFKVQTAAGISDNTTKLALSSSDATTGQWIQLTATYDAGAKKIRLYVNGASSTAVSVSGVFAGQGPLQIGRAKYKNNWGDTWIGAVAEIRVWERALTTSEAAALARGDAAVAGSAKHAWLAG